MVAHPQLDEMAKEGVDGSQITYEDNQVLLDMILSKTPTLGLLAITDEETMFPKVNARIGSARLTSAGH